LPNGKSRKPLNPYERGLAIEEHACREAAAQANKKEVAYV